MKFLTILLTTIFASASLQLSQVRKSYTNAAKNEANAEKFATLLESVTKTDANKTLVAYKGCALTLKSKFSNYLPDKISFMKEGAGHIDDAAAADPNNIEIRMIRLSVQENVPFIVGYRDNIDEDKAFIAANYAKTSKETRPFIKNFILQSESFTAIEKKKITQ
ncbi:MAG: hypothetical protein EOO50_14910 [Flavobacterium sp.]|uniref:hypothetical protein n=1 Tax=Flavobacterium sp. TaxID=239 RepID=UPI00121ECED6|nr:hypothetical protein [Flavobacterium sp.]RZJ65128.1 MAG: hypothetical protein EOO50_14910 [Flavobacterium sp.]